MPPTLGTRDVVDLMERNVETNRAFEKSLDQITDKIATMKADNKRQHDEIFWYLEMFCKAFRRNSSLLEYSASRSRSRRRRAKARYREFDVARPRLSPPVEGTAPEETASEETAPETQFAAPVE